MSNDSPNTTQNGAGNAIGLFLLRLGIGVFMLTHGIPKLMNYASMADQFPDPIGMGSSLSLIMAIGAEVGCSLLLILGLFTRLATLPLIITMMVAVFIIHGGDSFSDKEPALLYLVPYLTLLFTGPGMYSADHLIKKLMGKA